MATALKIIIAIFSITVVFLMSKAYVYGRKCRAERNFVSKHKMYVNFSLALFVSTILLIESSVRLRIFSRAENIMLFSHVIPAIIFLSLFLSVRFKFTGIASPAHKILTRICFVGFAVAFATGAVLLWSV